VINPTGSKTEAFFETERLIGCIFMSDTSAVIILWTTNGHLGTFLAPYALPIEVVFAYFFSLTSVVTSLRTVVTSLRIRLR
jgi:hypothetical protein